MKIPNPSSNKSFDKVYRDLNGEPLYGIRNEGSEDEEIVHIPTNKSNQTYYVPEMVLNPEGCEHEFVITDIGKREAECAKCHLDTGFIVGVNTYEINGQAYIIYHGKRYPLLVN